MAEDLHVPLPEQSDAVELPLPHYKFVFWQHTPENAVAAAEQLAPCDVLAIEWVGRNQADRQEIEDACSVLVSSHTSTEQKARADLIVGFGQPAVNALLHALPAKNQRVFLVDIGNEHPDWPLVGQMNGAEEELAGSLANNEPNAVIKEHILAHAHSVAAQVAARELETSIQLSAIGALPESTGKLIGAALGGVHTHVYHEISQDALAERSFVDMGTDFALARTERARFSHSQQLFRQLRLRPDLSVSNELLERMTIEYTLAFYHYYAPDTEELTEHDAAHALDRAQADFTDKLSDVEIANLLEQLDTAKANSSAQANLQETTAAVRRIFDAAIAQVN